MCIDIYTHIEKTLYMQGFSHWGEWGRVPPTKFLSPPLPLTSKQQFSSYNTIKIAFSAALIALAPFWF